jgi:hypothetical protein
MRSIDVVTLRRLTSKVAETRTSNRTRSVLRDFVTPCFKPVIN